MTKMTLNPGIVDMMGRASETFEAVGDINLMKSIVSDIFLGELGPLFEPDYKMVLVSSALQHLEKVLDKENKYFGGTIKEVNKITRNFSAGGSGEKAEIVIVNKDGKEESITTGWITCQDESFVPFETLFSRAAMNLAQSNIGNYVIIQKFVAQGKNKNGDIIKTRELLSMKTFRSKKTSNSSSKKKAAGWLEVYETLAKAKGEKKAKAITSQMKDKGLSSEEAMEVLENKGLKD